MWPLNYDREINMKLTNVIASQRPWNKNLAERLSSSTGQLFILITRPEELVEERLRQINPAYIFFPHWSTKIPSSIWDNYESIIGRVGCWSCLS